MVQVTEWYYTLATIIEEQFLSVSTSLWSWVHTMLTSERSPKECSGEVLAWILHSTVAHVLLFDPRQPYHG